MNLEYDEESDAAFVWLGARPPDGSGVIANELWPDELKGKIGLLFDSKGRLIGVEILEASARLPAEVLPARDEK